VLSPVILELVVDGNVKVITPVCGQVRFTTVTGFNTMSYSLAMMGGAGKTLLTSMTRLGPPSAESVVTFVMYRSIYADSSDCQRRSLSPDQVKQCYLHS
jgi:hypothetical protein